MSSTKPLFILFAEDNDDHAEMIEDAFEEFNKENTLQRVANGKELIDWIDSASLSRFETGTESGAIELIRSKQPDLILLDIKMPRVDGLEALQYLKQNPNTRKIPVLMLTTSENKLDIQNSYELGASAYIVKPFDYKKLTKKLHSINRYWVNVSELPDA